MNIGPLSGIKCNTCAEAMPLDQPVYLCITHGKEETRRHSRGPRPLAMHVVQADLGLEQLEYVRFVCEQCWLNDKTSKDQWLGQLVSEQDRLQLAPDIWTKDKESMRNAWRQSAPMHLMTSPHETCVSNIQIVEGYDWVPFRGGDRERKRIERLTEKEPDRDWHTEMPASFILTIDGTARPGHTTEPVGEWLDLSGCLDYQSAMRVVVEVDAYPQQLDDTAASRLGLRAWEQSHRVKLVALLKNWYQHALDHQDVGMQGNASTVHIVEDFARPHSARPGQRVSVLILLRQVLGTPEAEALLPRIANDLCSWNEAKEHQVFRKLQGEAQESYLKSVAGALRDVKSAAKASCRLVHIQVVQKPLPRTRVVQTGARTCVYMNCSPEPSAFVHYEDETKKPRVAYMCVNAGVAIPFSFEGADARKRMGEYARTGSVRVLETYAVVARAPASAFLAVPTS